MGNKETGQPQGRLPSTPRMVYLGVLVIVLLSGLQFFLILTLGDDSLKTLDRTRSLNLVVTRVVDLNFPSMGSRRFETYLSSLSNAIRTRLGYQVGFTVRKTVFVENYISADDMLFGSRAARNWFTRFKAAEPCWEGKDFSWLDAILADRHAAAVLEVRYRASGSELRKRVKEDFLRRFRRLQAVRDRSGRVIYRDRSCFRAASICWAWLLSSQISSDFVFTNAPVFFPSALTPVDALTRGGLVLSMITPSKRAIQGALAFSTYAVRGSDTDRLVRYSLQGFARLLDRRRLSVSDPNGLLYPVFGGEEREWAARDRGYVYSGEDRLQQF